MSYSVNNQHRCNNVNVDVYIQPAPYQKNEEVNIAFNFDNIGAPPICHHEHGMLHDPSSFLHYSLAPPLPDMGIRNGGGFMEKLMQFGMIASLLPMLSSLLRMMIPFNWRGNDFGGPVNAHHHCPDSDEMPPTNQWNRSPENTAKAARTLLNDPKVTNGTMTKDNLTKIVNDRNSDGTPKYAQATRDAAQYFLDHPKQFTNVESANHWQGDAPDGILGKTAMAAYLQNEHHSASQGRTDRAWDKLTRAGVTNGTTKPTMQQLRDIAHGLDANGKPTNQYDQATRNAAQYFIDNPGQLGKVKTPPASPPTNQWNRSPENTAKAARTLLNDPKVTNGTMTKDDLVKIAGDPNYDQATRDAAQYFLDHPKQFTNVESADHWQGDKPDGIISKNGMAAYLENQHHSAGSSLTNSAWDTLTRAGITDGSVKPTMQRLRDIAHGRDANGRPTNVLPDVRNAAQYFIDNPKELA